MPSRSDETARGTYDHAANTIRYPDFIVQETLHPLLTSDSVLKFSATSEAQVKLGCPQGAAQKKRKVKSWHFDDEACKDPREHRHQVFQTRNPVFNLYSLRHCWVIAKKLKFTAIASQDSGFGTAILDLRKKDKGARDLDPNTQAAFKKGGCRMAVSCALSTSLYALLR